MWRPEDGCCLADAILERPCSLALDLKRLQPCVQGFEFLIQVTCELIDPRS